MFADLLGGTEGWEDFREIPLQRRDLLPVARDHVDRLHVGRNLLQMQFNAVGRIKEIVNENRQGEDDDGRDGVFGAGAHG